MSNRVATGIAPFAIPNRPLGGRQERNMLVLLILLRWVENLAVSDSSQLLTMHWKLPSVIFI